MELYRKTQYGSVVIAFCLLSAGVIYSFDGPSDEFLYSFFILLAVLSTFGWLTVIIDRTHLKFRMGIGLFRKTIPLKDIKEVRVTKIPWWMGTGIRYNFGKTIYNVSGFQAIEITLVNNKALILGTADPNFLKQKIESARSLLSTL